MAQPPYQPSQTTATTHSQSAPGGSAQQNLPSGPSTVPGGGGGPAMDTSADLEGTSLPTAFQVNAPQPVDPHRSLLASIPMQYPAQQQYEVWRQQQLPPPPFQYYPYQQYQPQTSPPMPTPYGYMNQVPYIAPQMSGGYNQPPPQFALHQLPVEADQESTTCGKGKRRATEQDEEQENHERRVNVYVRRLRNAGVSDTIINSLDLYSTAGISSAEELIQHYEGQRSSMRSMESRLDRLQNAVDQLIQAQITPERPETTMPARNRTPVGQAPSSTNRARQPTILSSSGTQQPQMGKGKRKTAPTVPTPHPPSDKTNGSRQPGFFARPLTSKLAPNPEPAAKRRRQGSMTNVDAIEETPTLLNYGQTSQVDAQQASIWHPPAPRTEPVGGTSSSCRYGPLIRVQMPGQLPPEPAIVQDKTRPEDYGPMTSDDESEEEAPKKKSKGRKKAQGSSAAKSSLLDGLSHLPGRGGVIPNLWGMTTDEVGPAHMRDNRMRGMLSRHVFHDPRNNVVYAGRTAIRAAKAALKREKFEADIGKRTIRDVAPWGLPQSPMEAGRLIRLARDFHTNNMTRLEAYMLLTELYTIALRTSPRHLDDAMQYILDNFNPDEIEEPLKKLRHNLEEIPRNWAAGRLSNPTNSTGGMGMTQPTGAQLFDIDQFGRYLLTHNRPGSLNFVLGTQFDYRRAVHRRSIFGYALARFFGPPETGRGRARNGHLVFTRCFAILAASPRLYRDLISQWNERNPDQPFVPQTESVCHFRSLDADDGAIANMNVDTVAEVIIHNGVPPEWIDHAYNFGVRYLDQVYNGTPNHQSMYDTADDERLRRLDLYGEPPAIPQWDGWRIPDEGDLIRSYFFERREAERGNDMMQSALWEPAGDNTPIRLLQQRQYPDNIIDGPISSSSSNVPTSTHRTGNEGANVDEDMENGEIRDHPDSNASTPPSPPSGVSGPATS